VDESHHLRVALETLDLRRGYEAPFLVRPDRLPLGKDSDKREEGGLP
jgi:hypothetical protein